MSRRTLCRCHCSACGSHFASLEGFDQHRAGSHGGGRYCLEPLDTPGFELVDDRGHCEMYPEARHPVRVWTTARSAGASQRLGRTLRRPAVTELDRLVA